MPGPLDGLVILDLSRILAGPTCTQLLGDLGAEVIKIESLEGDDTRQWGPPFALDAEGNPTDLSAYFMSSNRNKKSVAVDLTDPETQRMLQALAGRADVVIENFKPGGLRKYGLDHATLCAIYPGLVYCSISGFGQTGPNRDKPGYDLMAQGYGGIMSITGEAPGRPPVKSGAPISDITAGILGAMGCAAAYARMLTTGEGQKVDTSLFEAGIVQTYWQSAIAFATGTAPGPMGSAHPLNAPYQAFPTSDGWITVGAANQKNWLRLLDVLEMAQLRDDPRFATNDARMAHREALESVLSDRTVTRTSSDWLERMEAAGLPAGPVLDILEMHRDPHARAREMFVETDHPVAGPTQAIGLPVKFSETPGGIVRPAPLLGQHGREVLEEAGYAPDQIDALARSGAVVLGD
ncbi:MAG: Crotonobetainyl-CoA:carnitine CoA-transferase CaiB [Rhodobacteraceae bacterium HLUCCA24]|nr:MAG: Crotonobetainyl-CoA:carnitine CoA-transferase CaiB [Rhodobacteraceae bacterium HLUCCA24]